MSESRTATTGSGAAAAPATGNRWVILVAAVGTVVAPSLGAEWWWIPALATFLVAFGRVYVGAHNPLDVVAGFGAGLLLGGALAAFRL